MKVLRRDLKRGLLNVLPENYDDLWHLYNVIFPGDKIRAATTRKVKPEVELARPIKGKRVSMTVWLDVESVKLDKATNRLRVHGTILEGAEKWEVRGLHHTINVIPGKTVTIAKRWLKSQLARIREAARRGVFSAYVVAIDDERCGVASISNYNIGRMTDIRSDLSGKMYKGDRKAVIGRFFKRSLDALRRDYKRGIPIVVVGPVFPRREFVLYLKEKDPELGSNILGERWAGSGGKSGIREVLRSGALDKVVGHIRLVKESTVVNELLARMGSGIHKVTYGLDQVIKASSYGAVEQLLVADKFLREASDEDRNEIEEMMRDVEKRRGAVTIISTEHEAGQKLLNLGGIAAFLRFALE